MSQPLEEILESTVVAGSRRYHLKKDEEKGWFVYVLEGGEGDERSSYRVKAWKGNPGDPPYFFIRLSDKSKTWLLPESDEEVPAPTGGPPVEHVTAPLTPPSMGTPQHQFPQASQITVHSVSHHVLDSFKKHCQSLRLPVIDLQPEYVFLKPFLRMYDTLLCDVTVGAEKGIVRDKLLATMRGLYNTLMVINNKVLSGQSRVLDEQKRHAALNERTIEALEQKETLYLARQEELMAEYNKRLEDLGRAVSGESASFVSLERELEELKGFYQKQVEAFETGEMVMQAEYVKDFADLVAKRKSLRDRAVEVDGRAKLLQLEADMEVSETRRCIDHDILPIMDRTHAEAVQSLPTLAATLSQRQTDLARKANESLSMQQSQLQKRFDILTMTPSPSRSVPSSSVISSKVTDFIKTDPTPDSLKTKHDVINAESLKVQAARHHYDQQVARIHQEGTMRLKMQATDYIKSANDAFNRNVAELVERSRSRPSDVVPAPVLPPSSPAQQLTPRDEPKTPTAAPTPTPPRVHAMVQADIQTLTPQSQPTVKSEPPPEKPKQTVPPVAVVPLLGRRVASPLPPDAPSSPLRFAGVPEAGARSVSISPPRGVRVQPYVQPQLQQARPHVTPPRPRKVMKDVGVGVCPTFTVSTVQTHDAYNEMLEVEVAEAERALREKETALHRMALEVDERRRAVEEGERAREEKDRSLKMVLNDIVKYKDREMDMQRLLREFRDKCDEYETTTADLHNDLQIMEGNYRQALHERDAANNEVRRLASLANTLTSDLQTDQESELRTLQQAKQTIESKYRSEVAERERECGTLREELEKSRKENQKLKAAAQQMELTLQRKDNDVKQTKGELQIKVNMIEGLEKEVAALKQRHKEEKDRLVADYKTHIKGLEEGAVETGGLRAEIDALKGRIAEMNNASVQKDGSKDAVIERLQAEREKLGATCETLMLELESAKQQQIQHEGRMLLELDKLRRPHPTPPPRPYTEVATEPRPQYYSSHAKPLYRRSLSVEPQPPPPIPPPQYAALTTSPVGFAETINRRSNSRSPSIRF